MRREANRKITIMGLLAECSTDDAIKLLKKYGLPDAKTTQEIEFQLAKLYKTCDDKKQLEKDFAEIHPHKEFIKKYLLPPPPVKADVVIEDLKPEPIVIKEVEKTPEIATSFNGFPYPYNTHNFSGLDGNQNPTNNLANDKDRLIIFGMFGFVSILALVLISRNN
jgi:hypothetical protein